MSALGGRERNLNSIINEKKILHPPRPRSFNYIILCPLPFRDLPQARTQILPEVRLTCNSRRLRREKSGAQLSLLSKLEKVVGGGKKTATETDTNNETGILSPRYSDHSASSGLADPTGSARGLIEAPGRQPRGRRAGGAAPASPRGGSAAHPVSTAARAQRSSRAGRGARSPAASALPSASPANAPAPAPPVTSVQLHPRVAAASSVRTRARHQPSLGERPPPARRRLRPP